jgi:hypothetical protein
VVPKLNASEQQPVKLLSRLLLSPLLVPTRVLLLRQ